MAAVTDQAFITLATNDSYALGALVVAHSLRNVKTTRHLVVMITPGVTPGMRNQLACTFDLVHEVNVLDSQDNANLALMTRPELGITFTKLHCWKLTQYSKCIFMDADMLVLKNCDELFEREELSAVADVGWPDCFNSGLFVYRPSIETYDNLLKYATENGSFDGGDQGLLNMFFSNWSTSDISKHLSFIYNMVSSVAYTYLPAYKQFGNDVKIVHFLGSLKPWMHSYNRTTGKVEQQSLTCAALNHLQSWWDLFMKEVQPKLENDFDDDKPTTLSTGGVAGVLAQMNINETTSTGEKSPFEQALDAHARQLAWERGQMDYMGEDSFSNIQKKLDSAIKK